MIRLLATLFFLVGTALGIAACSNGSDQMTPDTAAQPSSSTNMSHGY